MVWLLPEERKACGQHVGFSVGYSFRNLFQLSGMFNWNSRSFDAKVILEDNSIDHCYEFKNASGTPDFDTWPLDLIFSMF